ncbi:MAG: winged helix-turn-helix transcriptional regulator [Candidatus Methanoplasma sp.]|nr:winged helix-turn-helix transcriptional regulator [Candidatus Methanoplasma sp.]
MESQNREWKESWKDDHLKTICAFANTQGGVLEIGRSDDGAPVGVPDADRMLEEIPNKIRNVLGVIVGADLVREGGRDIVSISVERYPNPINLHGRYYRRSGSTTQEISGASLDEFVLRAYGRTWDSVPLPGVAADDLDPSAFRAFRRLALSRERLTKEDLDVGDADLLKILRLVEGRFLTRAAVLLFHEDSERWIRGAYVKIAYFTDDAEIKYQDEVHGPLVTMPDRVLEVLFSKYFKGLISYEGIQRVEDYPVAKGAIREAVINAIAHKNYSACAPIQIRVYDDKVMVMNDWRLPEDWSLDDLIGPHQSRPHNPLVADAFFKCGHTEAWGRGVERIRNACRAAKKPEPSYYMNPSNIILTLNVDKAYLSRLRAYGLIGTNGDIYENESWVKILDAFRRDGSMTIAGLSVMLGVSEKTAWRHLAAMREAGLIDREGPDNGGRWIVNVPVNVHDGVHDGVHENVFANESWARILDALRRDGFMTIADLSATLGISEKTVWRHLGAMRKAGLIDRKGPDMGGRWIVKVSVNVHEKSMRSP